MKTQDQMAAANLALETAMNHFREAVTVEEIDCAIAEINAAEQRLTTLRADCCMPTRYPGHGRPVPPWRGAGEGELRCAG